MDEAYSSEKFVDTLIKSLHFKPLILKAPPIGNDSASSHKTLPKEQPTADLFAIRASNMELLQSSRPFLDHISLLLSGRPHIVVISDPKGVILEVKDTPEKINGITTKICAGACVNGDMVINSGIGLAISLKRPVLVYEMPNHPIINLSIPIQNAEKLYGCLGVWFIYEDGQHDYLNNIRVCVNCIENTLNFIMKNTNKLSTLERFARLGGLLSTAIHDLKNPLTIIRAVSELGGLTTRDEKDKLYFQRITDQVDRVTLMLNQLLSVSKGEEPVLTSPVPILQEIIDELEPLCLSQYISTSLHVDGDASIYIQPILFKRAVHNLFHNAIKVMPNGGKLEVKVHIEENRLIVSISDTGPGLSQELQENVFQPFINSTTGGTGLGLYMVNQTITSLEGTIWFETEDGQGTTFHIGLPIPA